MSWHRIIICFTLFCLLCLAAFAQEYEEQSLFIADSDDWFIGGDASWTYQGEVLTGDASSGGGFVMTKETHQYFTLELEFKPDGQVNSGVFIRCAKEELSASNCYELNIWDNHPNQAARTGAVVTRSEPLETVHTIDQWNTYKIVSRPSGIQAWINNVQVVDLKDNSLSPGFIALQAAENGVIQFRNVRIDKHTE